MSQGIFQNEYQVIHVSNRYAHYGFYYLSSEVDAIMTKQILTHFPQMNQSLNYDQNLTFKRWLTQ